MVPRCILTERNIVMWAQLFLIQHRAHTRHSPLKMHRVNKSGKCFGLSLTCIKHQSVKKSDFISSIHPKMSWFFKICNYCKISIKGQIVSRKAFLLHTKCLAAHLFANKSTMSIPSFPCHTLVALIIFRISLHCGTDLNNYTDLHKTIPIKLNGFSWWVPICGNYKKGIVLFFLLLLADLSLAPSVIAFFCSSWSF